MPFMQQTPPTGEHDPAGEKAQGLTNAKRALLLAAGFIFLATAFLMLLYGNRLLLGQNSFPNDDEPQLQPVVVGTPRTVEPPINISAAPESGEAAPGFLLSDLQGEEVSLSQFKGQPVIINFWATWCAPCIFEMPELQAAYEAHQESGLVVLALNRDEDPAVVGDFLANDLDVSLSFPVLLDEHALVADSYGILNMPTTFFVDADGNVSAMHRGPLTREQIETYLAEMS